VNGLFEWLRLTEAPRAAAPLQPAAVAPAHLAKDAQFEMATADEKFLAEAKQMELSPLDSCHYRELVAQLIQGITQRMNVSEHLQIQGSEVQDSYKAIVKDLADVRHQAQDIYQKIHSMIEFLQYQDQTSQYYTDLMNKLERMNSTLGGMLHYLDKMQSRIEDRLHMIQGYLGWALSLTAIWTCITHTGYFVLCAVLLTFLHCPGF
uniref:Uncharacterized protein n=1 Tax=Maylandia zebra TaxID=106582 RepID=A0A3P9CJR4_9CICH